MRRGDTTPILGEGEGRLERPDRDCEELLRLGILKGRPGGRLGRALAPGDDADLEIFPPRVVARGRLSERRAFEWELPSWGDIARLFAPAHSHERCSHIDLWKNDP